ncbi:uncharacterized protein AC631_01003 [Debaryomyces fabryi]|uniref:Uncharacterized protein n=1 Tax=Debaryomyces fabryi TaxID=58627 RepID=A0A0V1Q407_9ASCO|nr:uncharacterized protein AC631_01003 [Debaryomyces fabryi]KSA03229.1 hypothetical protein AC631_01003 [Debaryomyces fabryi]
MIDRVISDWTSCNGKSSSTTSLTEETAISKSFDNLPRFTNLSIFQVDLGNYTFTNSSSDTNLQTDGGIESYEISEKSTSGTPDIVDNEFYIKSFNSKLSTVSGHANIFRIERINDFLELFQFYYTNKLLPSEKCFPYFHGLNSIRQRIFFCGNLNIENPESFASESNVVLPDLLKDHFHLMFINSKESGRQLNNLCFLSDLLTPKEEEINFNAPQEHAEFVQYKAFNHINEFSPVLNELNNRNFSEQMKLMAPLSNFLIYNDSMDFSINLNSALTINELTTNKFIYIVDVPQQDWNLLDQNYFSHTNEVDLFRKEQNMLLNLNSMKSPLYNVFTGTVKDFQSIVTTNHAFKLFIHCHKDAEFPKLYELQKFLDNTKHDIPLYLEFPSSGSLHSSSITFNQTLCYLNVLKLIHHYARIHDENVFIFSGDGFTELSMLTLSLGCLWDIDKKCGLIEEVILTLLGSDKDLRLYFFKNDLVLLKKIERIINWVKLLKLHDRDLVLDLDYNEINISYNLSLQNIPPLHYDWFNFEEDNNFPSKILPNLYLGSLRHASSYTVTRCLKISRIICVGERPLWFSQLNTIFEHELDSIDPTGKEVIKPIYSFNDDLSKVYEISNINLKKYPTIKLVIFIYNVKDDGRDSMMPLLIDCPYEVQSKLLINPENLHQNTLIHCRIGVSRSATLAIALVMKFGNMTLLEAYMFVRVRRFNIIIQPNLRLFYELFCFEEYLNQGYKTHSWWSLCQEISKLNSHYFN